MPAPRSRPGPVCRAGNAGGPEIRLVADPRKPRRRLDTGGDAADCRNPHEPELLRGRDHPRLHGELACGTPVLRPVDSPAVSQRGGGVERLPAARPDHRERVDRALRKCGGGGAGRGNVEREVQRPEALSEDRPAPHGNPQPAASAAAYLHPLWKRVLRHFRLGGRPRPVWHLLRYWQFKADPRRLSCANARWARKAGSIGPPPSG